MQPNKSKFQEGFRTPLTDLQLELLKLYSTNLTEEEIRELKQQIANRPLLRGKGHQSGRSDMGRSRTIRNQYGGLAPWQILNGSV